MRSSSVVLTYSICAQHSLTIMIRVYHEAQLVIQDDWVECGPTIEGFRWRSAFGSLIVAQTSPFAHRTDNYKITLKLIQTGDIFLGESRVEKIGAPDQDSLYRITGEVTSVSGEVIVKHNDTTNIELSGLTDNAVSIIRMQLVYDTAQASLNGPGFYYTSQPNNPDGEIHIVATRRAFQPRRAWQRFCPGLRPADGSGLSVA
jgi:hypothetical protein